MAIFGRRRRGNSQGLFEKGGSLEGPVYIVAIKRGNSGQVDWGILIGHWPKYIPLQQCKRSFCLVLKRRLRFPIFEFPFHCTQCDETMDVYGDHALVLSAAGDRISRHNLLKNKAFYFCQAAA